VIFCHNFNTCLLVKVYWKWLKIITLTKSSWAICFYNLYLCNLRSYIHPFVTCGYESSHILNVFILIAILIVAFYFKLIIHHYMLVLSLYSLHHEPRCNLVKIILEGSLASSTCHCWVRSLQILVFHHYLQINH